MTHHGPGRRIVLITLMACMALTSVAACTSAPEVPPLAWRAGTSSRSIVPTVDGSQGYAAPERLPLDADANDPGVFAEQFDQGPISVGNGRDNAHWVRDDLRVRALALERPSARDAGSVPPSGAPGPIVVLVAADVYMVFRPDAEELRRMVREVLPDALRSRVEVLVAASHNHHGPDTAFAVNPEWYRFFLEQARDAVRDAVQRLEPAELRVAEGTHYFGASDLSGIRVYDPTLGVLQARASDARVIATLVQWANHPESTLNWAPPREGLLAACRVLQWEGDTCSAEGRYLTADYPGALARWLERRIGGEVLYVNGAIGAMASPLGVPAWEVSERAPVGDGYRVPAGAQPPGGQAGLPATAFDVRNFRKAILIGEQLGVAVEALLAAPRTLDPSRLEVRHQTFFTRMSNIGFRKLAVVDATSGRSGLGFKPGPLFICPAQGPKTDAVCTDDARAVEDDPVLGPIRRGDHTKTAVTLLRIGDLSMVLLPGEVPGELVMGLPRDVRTHPGRWADEAPSRHAPVETFEIPGYVKRLLPGTWRWAIGLGNDEIGYILPLADYRIRCVADTLAGAGACARLHAAGAIEFPDGISGARCKALTEQPALRAALAPGVREGVLGSCRYGQAMGQAAGHYEETNSVGWDAAADMIGAVSRLTGVADATMVNDAFAGHWHKYPPGP